MNILIIGNEQTPIKNYSTAWLKFLPLALQNQGIEIGWFPRAPEEKKEEWLQNLLIKAEKYDHILAPGVRYFSMLPKDITNYLHQHFRGAVTQICDGPIWDTASVDINFTIKDLPQNSDSLSHNSLTKNIPVGWGADEKLFFPEPKTDNTLTIFVDHANFDCKADFSLSIFMNIAQGRDIFRTLGYNNIKTTTLIDGELLDVDLDNINIRPFKRHHIPVEKLAAELRQADIFMVTHQESVGLTALEAAKCGALVVCPKETIPADRLACLKHKEISFPINWVQVLNDLSKTACVEKVAGATWDNVATKVINGLKEWERHNRN